MFVLADWCVESRIWQGSIQVLAFPPDSPVKCWARTAGGMAGQVQLVLRAPVTLGQSAASYHLGT
jgi:hypothetical protein